MSFSLVLQDPAKIKSFNMQQRPCCKPARSISFTLIPSLTYVRVFVQFPLIATRQFHSCSRYAATVTALLAWEENLIEQYYVPVSL
jgi:hypothetical protein